MRVFLAEKPSVAKDLARALGCTKRENGYFIGERDIVTYAIGHLVELAKPEVMNPDWIGSWFDNKHKLPMLPKAWTYVDASPAPQDKKSESQFSIVKKLFNQPNVTEIVNAADAGREGEAIFRRIYNLSGSRKPVKRFWASSLTEEAIAAALDNLKPAAEFDGLWEAARTRAIIDWLWGMNYTRAYTVINGSKYTIGRVQTPTLALIVRRQQQISSFVKSNFYQVQSQLPGFVATALNPEGKYDFETKPEADAIAADCPPATVATVTAIDIKPKRKTPPQLYNLGSLQKDANNKFGYTAAVTLELAQSLYETHKVLTYPRTSSRHLSTDMVSGFAGTLRAVNFPAPQALVAAAIARAENGPPLSKAYVDDTQLSDHHAMIPTRVQPKNLTDEERNIYELVAKRFLSIFLPERQTEETRVSLDIAGHKFAASGSRLIDAGWSAVYQGESEAEETTAEQEPAQQLPAIRDGQQFPTTATTVKTKERKPPSRYTDATLIAAMESAGQDIEEDELRAIMKGKGLGTEATRAAILKTLEIMEYIARKKKFIEPTEKGTLLIQQVSERVASAKLTADMEEKLEKIEHGQLAAAQLTSEIESQLTVDIPAVLSTAPISAPASSKTAKDGIVCPKCKAEGRAEGQAGVIKHFGTRAFYSCTAFNTGCKFTINTEISGVKITQAHVKQLCEKGKTSLITKFVSQKTGKPYSAYLVLEPETYRVKPEFEKRT